MKKRVVAAVLLLLALTALWGCSGSTGSGGTEKKLSKEEQEACVEIAGDFLSRYQKMDSSVAELLYMGDGEELSFDGYQGAFAEQIEYEIGDFKQNGANAWVEVQISNADFKAAFESAVETAGEENGEQAILDAFSAILASEECPRREFECTLYLASDAGAWKVFMDSSLSNALTGGATEYFSEYLMGGADDEKNE